MVHPATGRVVGPKTEVRLEPRIMAVLEVLARSPGELVTRHELLDEIWPGGGVYEEALTQAVYQLRQQLLSAGGNDQYRNLITTIPKRGFVLKADVAAVADVPQFDAVAEEAGTSTARRTPGQGRPLIIGALAVVLAVGAVWAVSRWWSGAEATPIAQRTRTIAVLPFLPLAENDRDAVLELGMADTLITQLSGLSQLVVRPVNSVRQFGALDRDSVEAGRELGVDTVVDGSLQRSGDMLRVTVRLLRVADGASLWAETIDEPFGHIFEVQDDICARIAAALALELGQDERRELERGGTSSTEAYERYMQGRYHLARLTPRDLRESLDHFHAAVALDPDYAQAWLALANVQTRIPVAGEVPPREYYPQAKVAANRALEIDPSLAEGHALLGWISHWFEWDWDASEAHFRRAIQLNPNDTESRLGFAHLLSNLGRHDEALIEVRRARELSPNYAVAAALEGGFLFRAGRHQEALHYMEAARQVGENLWLFRMTLAGVYAANGRLEDSLVETAQAKAMTDGSTWVMANELAMLLQVGRRDEAEEQFARLLQRVEERYVPPYDLAVAYMAMGDLDSALAMLEQALEVRDPKLVFVIQPLWTPLRDQSRFKDVVQQLNLPLYMK